MTVFELQQLPADLEVLVEGYETGLDPIHNLKVCSAERNAKAEDWDGEFEESPGGRRALLILGRRGHRRD